MVKGKRKHDSPPTVHFTPFVPDEEGVRAQAYCKVVTKRYTGIVSEVNCGNCLKIIESDLEKAKINRMRI